MDLILRSTRVATPEGLRPAAVAVSGERIADVLAYHAPLPAHVPVVELGGDALLPGLVDTHVHINEPGRTAWEGFASATRAAAAGGVTTLIDMPLNSVPPTTTPAALEAKREAARDRVHTDVGFWGGAIPGNGRHRQPLLDDGVFGFKCFLLPSGVDEFPELSDLELANTMKELTALGGLLIVHAEDASVIRAAPRAGGRRYPDFLASRPGKAENTAVERLIAGVRRFGTRIHVLHLSCAEALPLLAAAKNEGLPITAETCPHYLVLTAEEVPDGATPFKCCPPIREAGNQEELWHGLAAGTLDCVVSDHSPCTPDLKHLESGDFAQAWGGIASLQLGLSAVWTEAARRGHGLAEVVRWMSTAPAELAGLRRKGAIRAGNDADFAVFAPEARFTVDPATLYHRHPVTPYAGRPLNGVVRGTWLRGRLVYQDAAGQHQTTQGGAVIETLVARPPGDRFAVPDRPTGRLIRKGEA